MSDASEPLLPRGRAAIFHPPGRLERPANPFGKDIANLALWRAVVRHGGYAQVDVLTLEASSTQAVQDALYGADGARPRLEWGRLQGSRAPREAGVVLRGQPYLTELAWMRRAHATDRAFSLVGWIHTLAPPAIRQLIAADSSAPTHPWDALVCTSPAVRENVEAMLGEWGRHLAERTGGRPPPLPDLPVIPLGVDGPAMAALADRPDVRARVRAEMGLGDDDVLVLWVGRLSYFEKAFPQPMFMALQQARAESGVNLVFALAGWFPQATDRAHYEAAARAHAPDVAVRIEDGNDAERVADLWAAADVFLSLVDNIQETFGITPLEAMAAGLPVVASDWDGYRFTIRHGRDGFLIPTLLGGAGGGLGQNLVESHLFELTSYQAYAGTVAQHTAVHVPRTAAALAELARNPDLRRRMGASGRARVAETFDWPVVARQVHELTDRLAEIRAAAPDPPASQRADPPRHDPFRTFAGFATHALVLDTRLAAAPGRSAADVAALSEVALDAGFGALRAPPQVCGQALEVLIRNGPMSLRDLLLAFPIPQRRSLELGVAWMAKYGLVDWLT